MYASTLSSQYHSVEYSRNTGKIRSPLAVLTVLGQDVQQRSVLWNEYTARGGIRVPETNNEFTTNYIDSERRKAKLFPETSPRYSRPYRLRPPPTLAARLRSLSTRGATHSVTSSREVLAKSDPSEGTDFGQGRAHVPVMPALLHLRTHRPGSIQGLVTIAIATIDMFLCVLPVTM